jgi:hypothetical protein
MASNISGKAVYRLQTCKVKCIGTYRVYIKFYLQFRQRDFAIFSIFILLYFQIFSFIPIYVAFTLIY